MNIDLSEPMKTYVEERVAGGTYGSVGDYLRDLIRADQQRQSTRALEQTLISAIEEGGAEEANEAWWQMLRDEVHAHAGKRNSRQHAG